MTRRYARPALAGLAALAALTAAAVAEPGPPARFRFADVDRTALGLWEGDRPVLVYNHGLRTRDGVPADRQRSTYVHPLYGPDGEVLTDDFPRDHYHHRGLFWAWPHVGIGPKEYDLWMLRGIRQQFERWAERKAERDAAVLAVENGWYVGERRVVREEVRFAVAAATAEGRAIDVALTLTALDEPVTLRGAEGKGYGGLSLRFAPRRDTAITTADGRQAKDLDLARLRWADLTARFEGARAASGVMVLVHPDHPDSPPTWITRDYGFLGVGWPGTEPVTLRPGRPVTCQYRLWIHRGTADGERLRRAYEDTQRR
jgi:hypothetical protein